MTESPRVVIADPVDPAALRLLASGPCTIVDASDDPAALPSHLGTAWGLVVRSRTKVTDAVLAQAPLLRVVARAGVGVDNVDLGAATRRGVRVVNAPTAATTSVAELTVTFALLLVRNLFGTIQATKAGDWKRGLHGGELSGKTVGLIGYGRIGREVARRLRAFGASVIAFDPLISRSPDETPLVPLEELLARSDVVSLHAALTPENHHLLNTDRLAHLRRGACVINVARGVLIDEAALLISLNSGQVGGAALDVFETEPPTRTALLAHPKVVATPHLGASTPEAQHRAGVQVAEELLRLLRGEEPLYLVNTEVPTRP
ncbi:MAG: hydroxyacid dehydrogenase [Thermoplasmata archaeon]|nr:hydroxyacid dehydrogenase [Thermoplasmata archaeon]